MADRLALEDLVQDELIQPSLQYPSTQALSTLAARLSGLDLARELVYLIPEVEATALPFLLDQFDMQVCESWVPQITDEERRNLILRSIQYHKQKSTFAGIKSYVGLAGGKALRAYTASDKFYAGEEISSEDRKRWKDSFPEIRIYDFIDYSTEVASSICGPAFGFEDSFLGSETLPSFFCGGWESPSRLGRKAVLVNEAGTTDLIWGGLTTDMGYEQLRIPGSAGGAFFTDEVLFQEFLMTPDSSERILSYLVSPEDTFGGYQHNLLSPGLSPVSMIPDRVYQGSVDEIGVYTDEPWDLSLMAESTVSLRVYDSIRLYDRENRVKLPYSTSYLDYVRFPVEPCTAEIMIEVSGVKSPVAFEFVDDYLVEDQLTLLHNALDAVEEAQSLRDRLYVNTKTHRPVRFGDRKKFNQFRFGEWKEI